MKLRYLLLLPCLAYAGYTQAEIYKRIDADGNVTYSNAPLKGSKKLDLGPLPTMPAYKESNDDFARVNRATQKSRDEARRKILGDELTEEEKLLAEARQNLKDAEDNPQKWSKTVVVGKNKDGSPITEVTTGRNVAGYEENVKAAQEQVTLHEKNVEALKMELSRFK
jgi:hypothetical protein